MLANHIRNLFSFSTWAWDRVFASVNKLDESAVQTPRQLFEKIIHATEHRSQITPILYLEGVATEPLDYASTA